MEFGRALPKDFRHFAFPFDRMKMLALVMALTFFVHVRAEMSKSKPFAEQKVVHKIVNVAVVVAVINYFDPQSNKALF